MAEKFVSCNLDGFEPSEEDMYQMAISQPLQKKIARAIGLLKLYERKALELDPECGYYTCFSGGKDSIVVKQLCLEAGVRFMAHYNNTTIDPPELYSYIREHHPDVRWEQMNVDKNGKFKGGFFQEVIRNGLPTPLARWCCRMFKEGGGDGKFKVVGVRAEESSRRKKLWKEVQAKLGSEFLCPILYWTDDDVWEFIRDRKLPYCSLYDQGCKRIGCIGCPMGSAKQLDADFKRYPKMEAAYRASALKYAKNRIDRFRSGTFKRRSTKPMYTVPEQYWFSWRNQVNRKQGREKCVYEQMIEQMGGTSLVEKNMMDEDGADMLE